ncbi:hypothetical protein [Streptomyces sp. NPDC003077]|uniref:SCO4983 family protein n=1 Tax=Streptomyces sp. NPDC003077 TaxID=3154443 RepID=UPI0033A2E1E9
MYEPIRTKSVHRMAADRKVPQRSREEELDNRLAGHLTALLTVTDELRALTRHATAFDGGPDLGSPALDGPDLHAPDLHGPALDGPALDRAADRIAEQVARLRGGRYPLRAAPTGAGDPSRLPALHHRARTLAGIALSVATSRGDAAAIALATERLNAHGTVPDLASA